MATKNTKAAPKRSSKVEGKLQLVKGDALANPYGGLFTPTANLNSTKLKVISRWPRLKPANMPLDGALVGTLVRISDCEIDGQGDEGKKMTNVLEILPVGAKVGVGLFSTAVLDSSLQVSRTKEGATSPYLGKVVTIQRLEEKIPSRRGQDAHNFIVAVDE